MAECRSLRRLPLTVQTAYADLVARLQDDALRELGGSPVLRERSGRSYWYTVQRFGDHTVERYLGPDDDDLRARIARLKEHRDELRDRERQAARLVRMCREGGLPRIETPVGKVLRALVKAGVFRLRGVLVGTHAFRCYPALLGVDLPEALAATEDIDVAAFESIALALDDEMDPALVEALEAVGPFIERPNVHGRPTAWRDRQSNVLVELLAPNQGPERDEPVHLPSLGASAQPLRFLDYLIHRPIPAAVLYRSGVLVNVPQPARYAVHKLIVATRRGASASEKARKDVEQSAALIRVLADDRPDELEDAYDEARQRGPTWRDALERGARRLPVDVGKALGAIVGH